MRRTLFVFACYLGGGLALRAQTPIVTAVANSGSFSSIVSPGAIVSILGTDFGDKIENTSVAVGGLKAPVLFVSNDQVNIQFPYNLGIGPSSLEVSVQGKAAPAFSIKVATYAPALLTENGSGTGTGIFTSSLGLVTQRSPGSSGQTITTYLVGLGATNPQMVAGTRTPALPASPCTVIPTVSVGGKPAVVESASLAPGLIGVYQVTFVVPEVADGDQDVVVSIGGVNSQAVLLPTGTAIRAAVLRDTNGTVRIIRDGTPIVPSDSSPGQPAVSIARLALAPGVQTDLSLRDVAIASEEASLSVLTGQGLNSSGAPDASLSPAETNPVVGGAVVGGTIAYTCDVTISAGICSTLNSTIAGLYSSLFTNATASIYIKFGSTGLGQNVSVLNLINYASVRTALVSAESDANDITAVTSSVPSVNPFGSDSVALTNPNVRALGFTAGSGIMADGATFCTAGTAGCYDGIITISSSVQAAGGLYFRSGPAITGSQYDFFSVVEHETDEILGTGSCAFVCNFSGTIAFSPADLFRYHSNGGRSFTAGSNSSCASSNANNACFSINAVNMLQQYNNLNNGEDAGDWAPNCVTPLVQNSEGCLGVGGLDISPAAEVLVLDVVGFKTTSVAGPTVTGVSSSLANGTYGVGASIPIQVSFNAGVNVTGTPQLALNSGGIARYSAGTGTATLTFMYTVGAGQNSADLDYASTSALTLNGGTIKDASNNAAGLTLMAPGAAGSLGANKSIVIVSSCVYVLGASSLSVPAPGGTGFSVSVTAPVGCGWTSTSNSAGMLTVTGGSTGTGNGTVTYSVATNIGSARQGTLTVAGQTFTVNQGAAIVAPTGVSPATGNTTSQTFTFTFVDPAGFADLAVVNVLINRFLDGRQACYIAFAPTSATSGYLYLVDDGGDGGYASGSPMALPSGGTLQNNQCTLSGTGSSVSASGNTLTLTLAVTFASGFSGNKVFYLAARSNAQNSDWQALGTWSVPGPPPTGPAVGGVNPARSTTPGQTYAFKFTDTNGFGDLAVLNVLTNNFLNGIGACYVAFAPTSATTGYLYLVDDAGDGGYASGSPMALPGSGTLQNSQCMISGSGSSVSASGNTLTLNLAIAFTSGFAGNRVFYLAARNNGTGNSDWQPVGSVTVP